MSWREDLRRVAINAKQLVGASFRGVPFFVDTSERTGGRRTVVHEFPLRLDPYVEDMGRKARTFRVEGYVLGDDYMQQRDKLLGALESFTGPGELVHPYHGKRKAVCNTVSVRESKAEGGIAMLSIDFDEAPAQAVAVTAIVDAPAQVAAKADEAVTATKREFTEKYDPTGMPSFALESASNALTSASAGLKKALGPVTGVTQELATLTGQIETITSQASSLVRQPAEVLDAFLSAITGLAQTAANSPAEVVDALVEAYGIDLGTEVTPTTATRERELDNQLAITGALRRLMAIEAARLVPRVKFTSIEEATTVRDEVAGLLEEQAGLAGDTAYPALVDLRSEVLGAVPGSSELARVVTVTRRVPVPSLVLSHHLYGTVDQEADIIARNRVRHPGFLVGDLKVLSDG